MTLCVQQVTCKCKKVFPSQVCQNMPYEFENFFLQCMGAFVIFKNNGNAPVTEGDKKGKNNKYMEKKIEVGERYKHFNFSTHMFGQVSLL